MKTPTTIEALEAAIAMLENIARGGSYGALDFHERLQRLKEARDSHNDQAMKDERTRTQIRELQARTREARSAP